MTDSMRPEGRAPIEQEVRDMLDRRAGRVIDPAKAPSGLITRARRRIAVTLTTTFVLVASAGVGGVAAVRALGGNPARVTRPGPAITASVCTWRLIPTPKIADNQYLFGVGGVEPDHVFLAGGAETRPGVTADLTEIYDGARVSRFEAPRGMQGLTGVSVVSDHDVWAVGIDSFAHHDGSAWTVSRAPGDGYPLGIDALSPNDVWAAGSSNSSGRDRAQTFHYDGTWHGVPTPSPGADGRLLAISGSGPNDVWSVGTANGTVLLEHWDGRAWTVATPPTLHHPYRAEGVEDLAPNDVWVVASADGAPAQPVILHYDGSSWSRVPTPAVPGGHLFRLSGIAGSARSNLWAVGSELESASGRLRTIALHFDGSVWTVVPTPPAGPAAQDQQLDAVTLVGGTPYAVGNGGNLQGLNNHYQPIFEVCR